MMSRDKDPGGEPNRDHSQVPSLHGNRSNGTSFLNRVGASALGLLQSSYGCPTSTTVSSDLASLHASASKGESSSNSTQRGPVSTAHVSSVTSRQDSEVHVLGIKDSLRTRTWTTRDHTQEEFNIWSTSHNNSDKNSLAANETLDVCEQRFTSQIETAPTIGENQNAASGHYGEVVTRDGAAVVSQLSNPTFGIDDVPVGTWEPISLGKAPNAEHTLLHCSIDSKSLSASSLASFEKYDTTVQERSSQLYAQNMKGEEANAPVATPPLTDRTFQMDGVRSLNKTRPSSTYGLIPDFEGSKQMSTRSKLEESQKKDIMTSILNAEEEVKPWLDILDRYQDEVWGDMLPLVQEARKELREAKPRRPELGSPQGGPAVRRLKMVLQHMDHSQN